MNIKATLLFLVGVLFLSSCERAVIPESRFVDIYHDILLADTYVSSTASLVRSTDSIIVYREIIEDHGFSLQQFIAAQNFYIAHPERFSQMMKRLQQRFIAENKELQAQKKAETDSTEVSSDL